MAPVSGHCTLKDSICPGAEPQVSAASSELVFVGYGIVAPEYGWDDYAGVDVRGKTVVVLSGDVPERAAMRYR